MPVNYQYDAAQNILHTTAVGVLVEADIIAHFQRVAEDRTIQKEYIELVQFDDTTEIRFSAEEATKFPSYFAAMKRKKGICATIFIGYTPLHFGIGRMMENLHEIYSDDDDIRVVHSLAEADATIREIRGA